MRASSERPFAAGRLQDAVGHDDKKTRGKTTNVGSCLYYLMFGELWLRPDVSEGGTCFGDTYPDAVGYYPWMPFHLT